MYYSTENRQREERAEKQKLNGRKKPKFIKLGCSLYTELNHPNSSVATLPPIKRDIYPLVEPLDTENNSSEPKDSEYINSSPNTLGKLKPCLELLEEIINTGQEVLKEMMVQLLANIGNPIASRLFTF